MFLLSLQIPLLFASGKSTPLNETNGNNICCIMALAPETPRVADFEEWSGAAGLSVLAPVTPSVASFEDGPESNVISLGPCTPTQADFPDDTLKATTVYPIMSPKAPVTAGFDDQDTIAGNRSM